MKGLKTGGRTKGTLNRTTAQVRESISLLIGDNLEQLKSDFAELEPKERIDALAKLLPYCIPKLQTVEYEDKSTHNNSLLLDRIEGLKLG